jgi:hypothetical protein
VYECGKIIDYYGSYGQLIQNGGCPLQVLRVKPEKNNKYAMLNSNAINVIIISFVFFINLSIIVFVTIYGTNDIKHRVVYIRDL